MSSPMMRWTVSVTSCRRPAAVSAYPPGPAGGGERNPSVITATFPVAHRCIRQHVSELIPDRDAAKPLSCSGFRELHGTCL
jgi:hypothetical protein